MGLTVLFEDNHLLVVDKPAGLLSQGSESRTPAASNGSLDHEDHLVARAAAWLKERYAKPGNVYVGLVHRLDRNTSGVVVLAKTSKAAQRLSAAFRDRGPDKNYLAVVAGTLPSVGRLEHSLAETDDHGSRVVSDATSAALQRAPTNGKRAALSFCTLANNAPRANASLAEIALETGRKHQIRVQFAAAGFPLLGDRRYAPPDVARRFNRPALHAWRITLMHPVLREELTFEAPLPLDFLALLMQLGLAPPQAPRNSR